MDMLSSPECVCARTGGRAGFLEQQALRSLTGGTVLAAVDHPVLCSRGVLSSPECVRMRAGHRAEFLKQRALCKLSGCNVAAARDHMARCSRGVRSSPECVCARAGGRAGFLEQQALRSLAGGNVAAAVHRLGLCSEALREESRASGYTPELCCRLGEVIGTQVRQHACARMCRPKPTAVAGGRSCRGLHAHRGLLPGVGSCECRFLPLSTSSQGMPVRIVEAVQYKHTKPGLACRAPALSSKDMLRRRLLLMPAALSTCGRAQEAPQR